MFLGLKYEPNAQQRAEVLCNQLATFGIEVMNVCVSGKDCASPDTPEEEINQIRRLLR